MSVVDAQKLQERHLETWTYLLRRQPELLNTTVLAVETETVNKAVTRYLLTLSDYDDPIALIGKETTAVEAQLYDLYGSKLTNLMPTCWFSQVTSQGGGWVVLEEVPHHYRPAVWSLTDHIVMIRQLARLHASQWGRNDMLGLPTYLGEAYPTNPEWEIHPPSRPAALPFPAGAYPDVGMHTGLLQKAYTGIQILRGLDAWPTVLTHDQLNVAEELINQPEWWLSPLRSLPYTLLHSRPSVRHWQVGFMGDPMLVDWQTASVGPGICDVVYFLADVNYQAAREGYRPAGLFAGHLEETLIDTYFLELATQLNPDLTDYPSRYIRRYALPAAQCLHTLTYWFPAFAQWFLQLPSSRQTWAKIQSLDDSQLATLGYGSLIGLRPYLRRTFEQFYLAYKLLCM